MMTISHLSIQHRQQTLLEVESLQLPSSGAIALIGPNGSGKTTLIKCLTGIQPLNTESSITLNNRPLHQYSGAERARLIGYIPQTFNPCWNQRTDELLTLAATRTDSPAAAIDEMYHAFELTPLRSRHWDNLSGGEKARVLSAMALAGNPPVLFADEPGAALDIKHRLQLISQLTQRGTKQLVLICLHELDMVFRYFEKVILMNQGHILFFGDTIDLLHQPLLDETFGVYFQRIHTTEGIVLHAQQQI